MVFRTRRVLTASQIVVGRVVLGAGIAIMTVAAPAYSIEVSLYGLSPSNIR